MGFFSGKATVDGARVQAGRTSRHSSGWMQMLKHLKSQDSLRILDIGPTSASNINFITNLGHSVYMANFVEDAARPEFVRKAAPDEDAKTVAHDVNAFLSQYLDFGGRTFDVVTLWDTADFLPEAFLQPMIDRLYQVMEPGAQLLAFFHSKVNASDNSFSRYHLTDGDAIDMQKVGGHAVVHAYTNRQIEGIFKEFASYRFFLAKDALREVIVTR